MSPSILNCTILGRNNFPYFRVTTDSDSDIPGYTSVRNPEGTAVGLIEWKDQPMVEVRNVFGKQCVSKWLALSCDAGHRIMKVAGEKYIWAPRKGAIYLYPAGTSTPELLARIIRAANGTISLEITPSAISAGLLETCVVATVLLQCGHKID
ncbi:hypothetical protein FB45DRAFT_1024597 [Roridomyces roridus]|uniref:DUF6593 domain-containing protein n=1 Tax=Roridomyces roridus TaxID=1738132 RepID=A0AAD7FPQ0_9AGAR|nr:hypothetical protein FB45DRAFT_1024597 [Roridomyces roridus]